ncbi:hypothetical protein NXS98_13425 [Fontisphaera persica]|uniref:hypothetical protein n=1 Tax=Fontisphaera persica TaxID=2974023 RepID=UPI0024C05A6F|nr:hypothetical protein [Fontisphaera persica]WCJ58710.1 hypothetical protein NXS98_13425 [Fontisphaera persica]
MDIFPAAGLLGKESVLVAVSLWLAAHVFLLLGWVRYLNWPQTLVVWAGTVLCAWVAVLGWMKAGGGLQLFQALEPHATAAVLLAPAWLAARLLAQDLWGWRLGRPHYGWELMLLSAVLALLPLQLLAGLNFWPAAPVAVGVVCLWQVLWTPWLIRKCPAPCPRSVWGPAAWSLWILGLWFWAGGPERQPWGLAVCLLPALLALWPWRRLSGAKAKPGPA